MIYFNSSLNYVPILRNEILNPKEQAKDKYWNELELEGRIH